ncbi:class I SAM-dependent methyltransferase [Desertibacillus haloalkaliphilus]|uniref:class I SAM-dependent methyltransferase n=1 Tax=Desertibacillus haloalkaliphilus TaxID=1328930 RepID=UPI001C269349|nr:SAM-dependent methyltransferase [Desertibacillus haloalkaliphilus]MBU8908988.1 SAM-dependent methyltransferase [Desertibacillus haloalkaliphilus]
MKTLLRDKIERNGGKITYATYIDTVLYAEQKGYYMKENQKIGKQGDFYTSSSIHSVFGRVFVPLFHEILTKNQLPIHICEIGGGDGRFAYAVLKEWQQHSPETFSTLRYSIVETSPYHRKIQQQYLSEFPQVQQFSSLEEMKGSVPHFSGVLFSNELFDALPVHVIEQRNHTLYEVFVTMNEDHLAEVKESCTNKDILGWINQFGPNLREGQRIEVPLVMNHMVDSLADWMEKGALVTIDYGYTKQEWEQPERMDGSLRGYYQHQLITNPLLHPGEMDLTTHIHFDALIEQGNRNGLTTESFMRQDKFLLAAGILSYLENHYDPNPFSEQSKKNRAIRSLITDNGMSPFFNVLLQQKNLKYNGNYQSLSHNPLHKS